MRGKATVVLLKDSPSNELAKRLSYEKPRMTLRAGHDPKGGIQTSISERLQRVVFCLSQLYYLTGWL